MKRVGVMMSVLVGMLVWPGWVRAQGQYQITDFESRIVINRDTTITVTETIQANFLMPKHGIFRVVPTKYSQINIDSQMKIEKVADEAGNPYQYTTSTIGNDLQIKIGDPNQTLVGQQTYVLTYLVSHMVRRFADHDELYWNVVGSKWDTEILQANAEVSSPWAKVTKTTCFVGPVGSTGGGCDLGGTFRTVDLGPGKDMTIVIGLDKNNKLIWPSWWEENWKNILGYGLALLPAIIMGLIWYKRGRDLRYKNNPNIYVRPEAGEIELVPIWSREYLPLSYTPIKDVTPAEAGTIIDQKVDVSDVVAEIVELARLGYIEIRKVGDDYWFIDKSKPDSGLRDYQKSLLKDITNGLLFAPKMDDKSLVGKVTAVSKMNGKFSSQLADFKNKLYDYLDTNDIFDGRPDKIRASVLGLVGLVIVIPVWLRFVSALLSSGGWVWVMMVSLVIAALFAYQLPRRTAWGHSLYRQLVGLRYYINEGKWRYEIAEKRLFIEEILPLAVSLGVVDKLAGDMKGLGIEAPEYIGNMPITNFGYFNSVVGSSMAASAKASGGWGNSGGSWSGGSGFGGGGSSGGGGGGGGGGSW